MRSIHRSHSKNPMRILTFPSLSASNAFSFIPTYATLTAKGSLLEECCKFPSTGTSISGWGIWVEMGAADFIRYVELYNDPDQGNESSFHGHVATSIPAYRETTLGIPVAIQLTGPTTRPFLFVEAGVDHLLAREQSNGVDVNRLNDFRASIRTESSSPIRCGSHGLQERAYVCQHFSKTKKMGFFEPSAPDSDDYDPDLEAGARMRASFSKDGVVDEQSVSSQLSVRCHFNPTDRLVVLACGVVLASAKPLRSLRLNAEA